MLSTVLQMGVPGTQEMIIVLLLLFLFLIPADIALIIMAYLLHRRSTLDERVGELEQKVERLQDEQATPADEPNDDLG